MTIKSYSPAGNNDLDVKSINAELLYPANLPLTLNDSGVRSLARKTIIAQSISFLDLFGKRYGGPVAWSQGYRFVHFISASNAAWTPLDTDVEKIHVFVIGGGGGGTAGQSDADSSPKGTGAEGTVAVGGGGGGGMAYSVYPGPSFKNNPVAITIGAGGAGGAISAQGGVSYGGAGGTTKFVCAPLSINIEANGGGVGTGSADSSYGRDASYATGGGGGSASGGNVDNVTGGAGGGSESSAPSGNDYGHGGGGAVRFSPGDGGAGTYGYQTPAATPGGSIAGYASYPKFLSTYLTGRGDTAVLSSVVTQFNGGTSRPSSGDGGVYGGGGGSAAQPGSFGASYGGSGGSGVVIVVYAPASA